MILSSSSRGQHTVQRSSSFPSSFAVFNSFSISSSIWLNHSYIWLLFSSSYSLFPWPIGGAHCWIDLAFSWYLPQVFQTDPLHPFVSLDCSRISLTVSVASRFLSQALLLVLAPASESSQLNDEGDSCWTKNNEEDKGKFTKRKINMTICAVQVQKYFFPWAFFICVNDIELMVAA